MIFKNLVYNIINKGANDLLKDPVKYINDLACIMAKQVYDKNHKGFIACAKTLAQIGERLIELEKISEKIKEEKNEISI